MKQIQCNKMVRSWAPGQSARNGTERTSRDTGPGKRWNGGPAGLAQGKREERRSSHFLASALKRMFSDPQTHESFIYLCAR